MSDSGTSATRTPRSSEPVGLRAGLQRGTDGVGARSKARYQPPLTHEEWVDGGWCQNRTAAETIPKLNGAPRWP
jgi:hypothetical protein